MGFYVLYKHNVFIVKKVYCVALFSVCNFQKGRGKNLFSVLVRGSVKQVGDKIFKSGGEAKNGWKQDVLEKLEKEPI